MRIAICTPNIERYDAVTNDVLGMNQAFCEEGSDCRIFVVNSYIESVPVQHAEDIANYLREPDDVFIYHHSVGWDLGLDMLRSLPCRKVVKYHNVTPSRFFKGLAENYFVACEAGRQHLAEIVRLPVDLFLADSAYNLHEISDMASRRIAGAVVPPFHKIDELQQTVADQHMLARFRDGNANFLMVGRIVPNKGYEYLIEAFSIYHKTYNPRSRLLIVGRADPMLKAYFKSLEKKIKKYKLCESVFFIGSVSAEELKACYQIASVFTITSLHEGFCVPLVEAMSMKVPIVGYASTAIPETVGKVGLIWEEHDPELMAASFNMIIENDVVRYSLGEMGKNRYRAVFDNLKIKACLLDALAKAGLPHKKNLIA